MEEEYKKLIRPKCISGSYSKLEDIDNSKLLSFIGKYTELCNPETILVCDGSKENKQYMRKRVIEDREEIKLKTEGHTIHFDGYYDQARDKEKTKYLLPEEVGLGPYINATGRKDGLEEVMNIMDGIMKDHTLFIQFFCLGPTNSDFSIPAVQLTDSSYVAHSQNMLYRQGYGEFKKLDEEQDFFKFVHSEGELENGVSKNIDKRRVYIDIQNNVVYSANTQYGGNTIGHKKLAMRLAINKASKEDWLTEHMFLMGVHGSEQRVTYFTGAFPSLCGKTSTSMVKGEKIVGDDIVYMRVKKDKVRAVNVEKGIFGILEGINSEDDPILWKTLNSPGEIIFSNALMTEDKDVYWVGKDGEMPEKGRNFSGEWYKGKKDEEGNEIPPSHPNARITLDLKSLENYDPEIENPKGVEVGGIIYGGRDSDTWVPVEESFDWIHGIITKGASLESETTAAALGKRGIRKFNPMANLAFVSVPLGKYIKNNIDFVEDIEGAPRIFSVNYFLRDSNGDFLNDFSDKRIWLKWMERRVHKEVEAIKTPTGYIPKYEDLVKLFKEVLDKDYKLEDYKKQFTIRIPENLSKIDRITEIYSNKVEDAPEILFKLLREQRERLEEAKRKFGDYVVPSDFNA